MEQFPGFPSELGCGWQFPAWEMLPALVSPSPETRSLTRNSWDTAAGISSPGGSQGVAGTAEPAFPRREGSRGVPSPVPAVPGTPCGTFPRQRRREAPASPWRQRSRSSDVGAARRPRSTPGLVVPWVVRGYGIPSARVRRGGIRQEYPSFPRTGLPPSRGVSEQLQCALR